MSEVNVLRGLSAWILQTCEEMRADPQVLLGESRSWEQAGLLGPSSSSRTVGRFPHLSHLLLKTEVLVVLMSCTVGNVPRTGPGHAGAVLGHEDGSGLAGARGWGLGWQRRGPPGALEPGRGGGL